MPKSAMSGARDPEEIPKRLPPARTRERRVQQLGQLAEDLLEERVRNGTASPTEVVALARMNSPSELATLERIHAQTELLKAQKAKAESETMSDEVAERAIAAIGRYSRGLDQNT